MTIWLGLGALCVHALVLSVWSRVKLGVRHRMFFVLKTERVGGVCVCGFWHVLLCLLPVLTAELLPAWFVQHGLVPLERWRFTAKSAKINWKMVVS